MEKVRVGMELLFLLIFIVLVASGKMMLWLTIFVISLLTAAVFGRYFCGYICPMNTLMRLSEMISMKMGWQSNSVPKWLQSRVTPWVVLILMILTTIFSKRILQREFPVLLILLFVAFFVTLRLKPWAFHNHICPYGALLRLTGKYAKFATTVNASDCIGCKKCAKVCDANAITFESPSKEARIDPSICHQCAACITICPVDAIRYQK